MQARDNPLASGGQILRRLRCELDSAESWSIYNERRMKYLQWLNMKRSLTVSDRKKLAKGSCSNAVGRSSGIDGVVFSCDGSLCSLDIDIEDEFS